LAARFGFARLVPKGQFIAMAPLWEESPAGKTRSSLATNVVDLFSDSGFLRMIVVVN
jgi:hypothetical protein